MLTPYHCTINTPLDDVQRVISKLDAWATGHVSWLKCKMSLTPLG